MISMMREYGGKVTLGQILTRHDGISAKYTQCISEAREILKLQGYDIVWHKKEPPTDSIYSIEAITQDALTDKETGQREWESIWKQTKIN